MNDDLISRQAAIDAAKRVLGDYEISRTMQTALHILPSAQPELCEYCNEDSDGYVRPVEKNGHAFIRFGMNGWELSLKANGWHGDAKIRYCPMCGRDLLVKLGVK